MPEPFCLQDSALRQRESEPSFFPFLEVAHKAEPFTFSFACEVLLILFRQGRFQDEYLDECSSLFVEMQTCLHHFRVVEHHQCSLREIPGEIPENVFADASVAVHQQFRTVALRERVFCYAFLGKRVVVVLYLYVSWISHIGCPINTVPRPVRFPLPDNGPCVL